jgi:hypothetical protein
MTNRIPLIVNAGAAQIQELSTSDNLLMPGTDIVGANTINTSNVIASANITASYFLGNGAFLTGISGGGNSTYTDANVQALLNGNITGNIIPAGNGTQTLGNATNPWESLYVSNATIYIASVPLTVDGVTLQVDGANVVTESIAGLVTVTSLDTTDLTSPGNVTLGNVNITGNVNIPGNITQVNGNSGQFFGNTSTGFGALYAGITTGYIVQDDTVIQVSADYNEFAQVNIQNINSGVNATSDFVATNDIGDNNLYYVNMGIASGSFIGASGNSLGSVIDAGDAYLYTLGNTGNAIGGNLVVGAGTAGKLIKLIAGSGADTDVTMVIDTATTAATSTTTGAVRVSGGMGVTGNVFSGNVLTAGNVTAAGGSIGNLTVSGTINAGNINANVSGSITSAINVTGNSQPNITSVGTLTSLSVAGNSVITGNLQVTGNVTYINSNVVAIGDLMINVANNASNASQALGGGLGVGPVGAEYATFTYNNSPSYWVSDVSLYVNGNIIAIENIDTTGNINGGNIDSTGNITAVSVIGNVLASTGNVEVSGNVNAAYAVNAVNIGGNLTSSIQSNVTSLGTLTSLSVSGNVNTNGNISTTGNVTAATLNISGIVNTNANGAGNIGSSTTYFNTVFAKSTSAQYADLAEVYVGDTTYAPGTVLSFGGTAEVTQSNVDLDVTIAGVVSTNPAYIMNTSEVSPNMVVVALTGRVPCFVVGPVTKGAMMVSAGNGAARAEKSPVIGSVIGKALQSFDGEFGTIEIVVGRL